MNQIEAEETARAQTITIDGKVYHVTETCDFGYLPMIETEEGPEFYLAENTEEAGKAARKSYAGMAEKDPRELTALVGEETLVEWALGHSAGPGSTGVSSLEEWLDLWLDTPEEEFASYDGIARDVEAVDSIPTDEAERPEAALESDCVNPELVQELGFWPTVAYRHN